MASATSTSTSKPAATAKPAAPAAPKAPATAPATATAAAAAGTTKRYKSAMLGIGGTRKPLYDRLAGIAKNLGCKTSDLIWAGVEQIVANPPKVAPAGASASAGSSPGFWVLHESDANGRLINARVVEVEARGDLNGGERMFCRYKQEVGEEGSKSRTRAMNQALRAAQYDLSLVGVKRDIKVETLEEYQDSLAA